MDEATAETGWCEALYARKAAGLLLYGRALGLSHGEAEDVLQETFLALVQMQRRPEEPENYCFRSYRNRAMNFRRSMWRRLTRELESRHWFETNSASDEHEAQAMRSLAELPSDQREVIVLKIWNELTFEAIAQLLELSPNTVAGRYRYGLNKLRQWMKETSYERARSLGTAVSALDPAPPVG